MIFNPYDSIFINNLLKLTMSDYDDYGENVRPKYESDGFPAHTQYLNHHIETYDVSKGEVPITSLRPIAWKSAIKEYLWIFQDQSNDLDLLRDKYNITWWDNWDIGNRTIGSRYGETVKKYEIMNNVLDQLKNNKMSRRVIIDLYQYADFEETDGLYPCMFMQLFSVRGEYLDLMTVQRSSDFIIAGDINKLQSIALLMMVAKATGFKVGNYTWVVNNLHIYDRHIKNAEKMITKFAKNVEKLNSQGKEEIEIKNPVLELKTDKTDFYSFTIDDFSLSFYEPDKTEKYIFELGV